MCFKTLRVYQAIKSIKIKCVLKKMRFTPLRVLNKSSDFILE